MMIETKGTKTAAAAADGAQKYVSRSADARSATPYYLALAVAALAAYLKSLFQTSAQAVAQPDEDMPLQRGAPKLLLVPASAEEPRDEQPDARLAGSSGSSPQAEPPASQFDFPHSLQTQALQFAKPDTQTNLNDFKASPVIPRPTNDNGGAASGGGGGGGGRRDEQPPGSKNPEAGAKSPPKDEETLPRPPTDDERPTDSEYPTGPGRSPGSKPGDRPGDRPGDVDPGDDTSPDRPPTGEETDGPGGRRNRAPVSSGPVYLADATGCALLAIAMTDLLRNVEDPDGDGLSIRNVSVSSGSLVRDGEGWLFDGDNLGPVTITYEVTDGEFAITQTAIFNVVERNQMVGTSGDDLILGTLCADAIDGRDGNDNIDARAGADVIDGGAGNDHIVAGAGDDVVHGGAGDDVIFAGAGADVVWGGTGNDRIFGEEGNDILFGDAGDDLLDGGTGSDIVTGGLGRDMLLGDDGDDRLDGGDGSDQASGGAGQDVVSGGEGDDHLDGGAGGDVLSDGAGRDVAQGGDGSDVFVAAADGEADRFDGGADEDTLDLSGTTSGVAVDLAAGTAESAETGRDQLVSVESVRGGSGADRLSGDAGSNTVHGGSGEDDVSGGAGNDWLDGGAGNDAMSDGTGSDAVMGGQGADVLLVAADGESDRFDGGAGEDTLDLSNTTSGVSVDLAAGTSVGQETGRDELVSVEVVRAGSGDDVLTGSATNETLSGGAGRDRLSGGAGDDRLDGGAGADAISDGAGSDVVLGGVGDDVITASRDGEADRFDGGAGQDALDLSDTTSGVTVDLAAGTATGAETGSDQLASVESVRGGSGADRLSGNAGQNSLSGNAGRDHVSGGAGNDLIDGGADNDTLSDGTGSDIVLAGTGDDVLVVALDGEADQFDGGTGQDALDLSATTSGVGVDLVAGTATGAETGRDELVSVEDVHGGSGDDVLTGSAVANNLSGGAGQDHVSGGAGNDVVDGGAGADALSDGTGSDTVLGGAGDDVITASADGESDRFDGGEGCDTLDLSVTRAGVVADLQTSTVSGAETGHDLVAGLEGLVGGSGNDILSGSDGRDRLSGGDGDDRLSGRDGDDRLEGGAGRDTLSDGAGRDRVRGGAGDDRIVLARDGEDDDVDGGEGCDTLDLSDATQDLLVDLVSHVVSGAEHGDDMVESMERILSGSGNDRFVIGDDDVVITGGDGNDGFAFRSGDGDRESTRAVQITDFSVGDYVDLVKYTLFEEGSGAHGKSLAEAMERNDGTVSGIQYRSARLDDGDVTVISVDLDSDDTFETTIILDGHHTLLFVEAAAPATTPTPTT